LSEQNDGRPEKAWKKKQKKPSHMEPISEHGCKEARKHLILPRKQTFKNGKGGGTYFRKKTE